MKYDLNLSLTTPPAEPPTELPPKQLTVGEPIPRPPSRKHSSSNIPTLSTPFEALPTPPTESTSAVPAPDITARDPVEEVTPPPAASFRGGTGTPLATIHEDKKLGTTARNWLMGKRGEKEGKEKSEDVKTATGSEPPRKPKGPRRLDDGHLVNGRRLMGDWQLPSAGVGERMNSDGTIGVDPGIEKAMRNTPYPAYMKWTAEKRVRELELERIEEDRLRNERILRETQGERVAETDAEKQARWGMESRRRLAQFGGGGRGGGGGAAGPEHEDPVEEDLPEEANEYTPSGAAPPEMIAAAKARAEARRAAEASTVLATAREEAAAREAETARETAAALEVSAREAAAALVAAAPALDPAPTVAAKKLAAAEKARAAVENEPHSPSWNGSTYIDGREHHYCGPDFPCQMEPVCDPSIKEIWDKGLPVTPDEMPRPKRASFTGPMRALFGIKNSGQPEQKYRKPVSIESIRVGNSAETTVIEEPRSDTPPGSSRKTSRTSDEAERGDCKTMRGLKKVWGFWTSVGGKMGRRRGVVVTKSAESLPVVQGEDDADVRYDPADDMAVTAAVTNLAASACYPVGESTVETAKVVGEADSGAEMDGIERIKN
ncbi:hypothetical protein VE02_03782 [Pseudogymnoascus sp. 03VT05]|nr:hypothetical protein VE02_03782 [Pseudogymnoascus sp. 03VT05]